MISSRGVPPPGDIVLPLSTNICEPFFGSPFSSAYLSEKTNIDEMHRRFSVHKVHCKPVLKGDKGEENHPDSLLPTLMTVTSQLHPANNTL